MREVKRSKLNRKQKKYLDKKQKEVNASSSSIEEKWKSARQTKTMKGVVEVLELMAGKRKRCMFCQDSHGVDIEHFRPKVKYSKSSFQWLNMLLVCTPCNRLKGDRFDFIRRRPKLIDPTSEDPWNLLFYDTLTGRLAAMTDPLTGNPSVRGMHAIDQNVLRLNDDAIVEGRKRTFRNLSKFVRESLNRLDTGTPIVNEVAGLIESVGDNDDFALAQWLFLKAGKSTPPFGDLRQRYPALWQAVVSSLS